MPITLNGDTGITTPGLTNTGSTTLVSLTTTGNTILGDQSTDTLNVANGNLVLNSSGNLGIGTASPAYRLDVAYNANATNFIRVGNTTAGASSKAAIFSVSDTSSGQFGTVSSTWSADPVISANETYAYGAGGLLLYSGSTNPLRFVTNGAERARIDSSGNFLVGATTSGGGAGVTVGTTSSGKTISVFASSYGNNGVFNAYGTDGGLKLQAGGLGNTAAFVYAHTGCSLALYSGGSLTATLDSSNNFGIGNASAVGKLEVYQNNNSGIPAIYARQDGTAPIQTWNVAGGAERARLNSAGDLGIGTASPGARLETYQSAGGTNAIRMNTNFGSGNYVDFNPSVAGVSNNGFSISLNGNIRQVIDGSGNLLVGTTASTGSTSNVRNVVGGSFTTQYGSQSIASTGVATTVKTFNTNDGEFIVTMRGSGTGNPTADDSVAIICVNAGNASQTNLKTGANVVISMSGLNLQVTQNVFAGANINWSVMRISV